MRIKWLPVLLVFIFLSTCSFSQIMSAQETAMLDSLVFAGDFEPIIDFFKMKNAKAESEKFKRKDLKEFNAVKVRYATLLQKINDVISATEKSRLVLVEHHKKEQGNFTLEYAGEKSQLAFQQFIALSEQGEHLDALVSYQIAVYFYNLHLDEAKAMIKNRLDQVEELYKRREYTQAHEKIKSVGQLIRNNKDHHDLLDRLERIENKIDKKVKAGK